MTTCCIINVQILLVISVLVNSVSLKPSLLTILRTRETTEHLRYGYNKITLAVNQMYNCSRLNIESRALWRLNEQDALRIFCAP